MYNERGALSRCVGIFTSFEAFWKYLLDIYIYMYLHQINVMLEHTNTCTLHIVSHDINIVAQ